MKIRPTLRTTLGAILVTVFLVSHAYAQTLRVTIRKAPVRSGPGSQTTLIANVMEGDLLELVDEEGLWYIVRLPATQQVGYIHSALVERTTQNAQPRPPSPPPTSQRSSAPPPPPVAAPILEPCAPPPPPPPQRTQTPPPPRTQPETAAELPRTQPSIDPSSDDAPWDSRGLGIGMRTGWGTLGTMAFNFRTWGELMGLSLDVSYLSNTSILDINGLDYARLQTQPSLLFKIGRPIEISAVYLQPYAGGGANTIWHRGSLFGNELTLGIAAFGGLDIGFMDLPNLTVSADLGYVSDDLWSTCGDLCPPSSFNDGDIGVTIGIDWYFK